MLEAFLRRPLGAGVVIACAGLCACSTQPARQHRSAAAAIERPAKTETDLNTAYARPPSIDNAPHPTVRQPEHIRRDTDIWWRVREGFSFAPAEDNERVRYYETWYAKEPYYLRLVTERAAPYLYFILQEIERRALPTELVLLPVVESAYIPFAYSRSHAAGLWQFIPDTGLLYGLKQNWWYDGRRDVYASTIAALDYLEMLNDLFLGDWLHTLAAYNAGPTRVLHEIETNRLAGKPIDYWRLDLPRETRNYVPKLLAVKHLVRNPARFGITLWPVDNKPFLASIDVEAQIDVAVAARLANMEIESFQLLNPGFGRWATDPDGPHHLLLPIDRVAQFKQRLAALAPQERMTWTRHLIKNGDTLTHIARRYKSDVGVLQQTNALYDSHIEAGEYLLVPYDPAALDVQRFASANTGLSTAATSTGPSTYTVQPGDSLWGIARGHNISVSELRRWNSRTSGDALQPGEHLLIQPAPITTTGLDIGARARPTVVKTVNYSVQNGDSLYAIARRFSVTVANLRNWNNLGEDSFLRPGQAMTLYLDNARSGGEG